MKNRFKTIVGGRSQEYHDLNNFPRGIEILLKKAKVDIQFQTLFLENPLAAAKSIDLDLKENEKKILTNTLKPVLKTMIKNTFVPKHHVKTFLTAKTAAMITLILASTVLVPSYAGGTKGVEAEPLEAKVESSLFQLTKERMAAIQDALEQYKHDHGTYPSTEEWLKTQNTLSDYITTSYLYDPWNQKFHYEVVMEKGKIVNYKLECLGEDIQESYDNIPCPIDTDKHRFFGKNPIQITFPQHDETIGTNIKEDGIKKTVALQAAHESDNVNIDWYIDGTKIGSTFEEHSLPVKLESGEHLLYLIDEYENNISVSFYVRVEE